MKINYKKTIFFIVTAITGYISYKYTHDLPILERLTFRIPTIVVFGYIYRKYIGGDKLILNKWLNLKFKKPWHKILLIIGILEMITFILAVHYLGKADITKMDLSKVNFVVAIPTILCYFPFVYTYIQGLMYSFKLLVYVYNNHKKWFELYLVLDDIVMMTLLSFMI